MTNQTTGSTNPKSVGEKPAAEETTYPKNYDPETGVFTLDHPIAGKGQTIEKVTLQRLKVKHVRAGAKIDTNVERGFFLVQKSLGMAPEDLDEMDPQDFDPIEGIVADFL